VWTKSLDRQATETASAMTQSGVRHRWAPDEFSRARRLLQRRKYVRPNRIADPARFGRTPVQPRRCGSCLGEISISRSFVLLKLIKEAEFRAALRWFDPERDVACPELRLKLDAGELICLAKINVHRAENKHLLNSAAHHNRGALKIRAFRQELLTDP
jgi:hypothetical protein